MANKEYILGSGVTNIARIDPFEVGTTYSKYDIVYFSGFTSAGTETYALGTDAPTGHYYYSGDSATVATAVNSPTGVNRLTDSNVTNPWTQTLFMEASYGSSVTYENQSYDVAFGDGYYNILSKSENSLKGSFNVQFNKRNDKESKALAHLLEDSFNKGNKPSGAYTGIYFKPFPPYDQEHEFYIDDITYGYDYPNVNTTSTTFHREDQSTLDWQGYYIPFEQTKGFWNAGETYGKHDIAYMSGITVPSLELSGWYYYSGESETTATDANGPLGDSTETMWTKERFYFDVNAGLSINAAPRYLKQPFQSDFYIRTKDGLNKSLLNMEFSFDARSDKESKAIVHFLEHHKGKDQFEFIPPAPYDITGKVFICPKWQHTLNYKDNNNVSVNFIEYPVNLITQTVSFSTLITVDPYYTGDNQPI